MYIYICIYMDIYIDIYIYMYVYIYICMLTCGWSVNETEDAVQIEASAGLTDHSQDSISGRRYKPDNLNSEVHVV